jgi:anaerobic magnesium-protoporphyrin IX monomethyl ester cyclase
VVDILLTHSYHLFYDAKQVRKMRPYPPLGTLYAAAFLRQQGFTVAVFDAMLEDPERGFPAALRQHRPRMVAVYEDNFNFLSKMCLTRMRRVAFGMMEAARRAGAQVVVNGSDATDHTGEYLEQGANFVLLGEAEQTLAELAQALLGGAAQQAQDISGVAYADSESGKLARAPSRPLLRDIDVLPPPARDLVDIGRYRELWQREHGWFSLNLVASRGCPYHCNWCAKPIYGQTFHVRSTVSVAEEMHELKTTYGANHLWFADDIFGLKPQWVPSLAGEVERRNAAVACTLQARVDSMTEDNIKALRRLGCSEVWLGVESGSQKILDAMEKGTRVEEITVARERLRRNAIRACFFLQFGYPGERWEDIEETIRLVLETKPDDIGVSVSYPLPGTTFHERVQAELGEKTNWVDSDELAVMFRSAYGNEFYRALRDALHAEVNGWNGSGSKANGNGHQSNGRPSVSSPDLVGLWRQVDELEKTCRNSDPTLASASCASIGEATS